MIYQKLRKYVYMINYNNRRKATYLNAVFHVNKEMNDVLFNLLLYKLSPNRDSITTKRDNNTFYRVT